MLDSFFDFNSNLLYYENFNNHQTNIPEFNFSNNINSSKENGQIINEISDLMLYMLK